MSATTPAAPASATVSTAHLTGARVETNLAPPRHPVEPDAAGVAWAMAIALVLLASRLLRRPH